MRRWLTLIGLIVVLVVLLFLSRCSEAAIYLSIFATMMSLISFLRGNLFPI